MRTFPMFCADTRDDLFAYARWLNVYVLRRVPA